MTEPTESEEQQIRRALTIVGEEVNRPGPSPTVKAVRLHKTHRRGVLLAGALVAAGAVAAGGLAGTEMGDKGPDHAPHYAFLDEATGDADVDAAVSPEGLMKKRNPKVVVSGMVEAIEQGRNIFMDPDAQESARYIVMQVKTSEVLRKGTAGEVYNNHVYVEMYQGPRAADGGPFYPLSEWRRAIPPGTQVMLFLHEDYANQDKRKIEHQDRGHPKGSKLMSADPQGMLFEYDDQLVGSGTMAADGPHPLGMSSIEETVDHVKRYLATHGDS